MLFQSRQRVYIKQQHKTNTLSQCIYPRPQNQKLSLNRGHKPRNHLQIKDCRCRPQYWTRIAVNHLKCRDFPRQVSHVLTEREGERLAGCWCRHVSFSSVLCSWTPHLRISHCFFPTIPPGKSCHRS